MLPKIRKAVSNLKQSEIREVANSAMGSNKLIPLWFGEDDLPSSDLIINEGKKALKEGNTFYTQNKGNPDLCLAISNYLSNLHNRDININQILVTASGMNGLMITAEAIIEPKDKVIAITPVWPNFLRSVEIMGGIIEEQPLKLKMNKWKLNLEELFYRASKAKAIYINSPNNPTGWMIDREDQCKLMAYCRKNNIWLIADEVYSRIVYDRKYAPSFLDIRKDDDPLIVINSFSKTWSMTGWRLGWLVLPEKILPHFEKLTEFNIASASSFVQIAGIKAIKETESIIKQTISRYNLSRKIVVKRLSKIKNLKFGYPEAAFYVFIKLDDVTDGLKFSKHMVEKAQVGLAPGIAFGKDYNNYFRICYAKSNNLIHTAFDRLEPYLIKK